MTNCRSVCPVCVLNLPARRLGITQLAAFDVIRLAARQLLHTPVNSTRQCLIENPAGNLVLGNGTGSTADSSMSKIALHEEHTR